VFSGAAFDRGMVSGKVQWTGTSAAPQAEGAIEWKNGRVSFPNPWLPMEDVETKIVFSADQAVFEETRGRMGEGTFGLAGKIVFSDWRNPRGEAQLRGANLSLYANENLLLKAAPDLAANRTEKSGTIKGTLGLEGSAVRRALAVTPQLLAPSAETPPEAIPPVPAPADVWTLDLKLTSAAPIPVGADGAAGSLVPDLYLQGSVREPLLVGTIHADKLEVVWPSGARLAAAGRVHFTAAKPWIPVLDLAGAGEAGAYHIRAGVFGPLDERKLLLSSAPPLTTEQIVLLLTTGVSPAPAAAPDMIPPTAEQKMNTEPSWLDLDKVRGLLGWGTQSPSEGESAEWSLGREAVGYEWSWR
jgi:translocation and assembly module TamB